MPDRFVYFDLGMVLVNFDHQIAVDQLAHAAQRSSSLVRQVVFDSDLQNRYETGLVSSQQFSEQVNAALDCELPAAEILEAISAIFQPNLPILAVIDFVKDLGIPMGILSNTCEAHWHWIAAQGWPVVGDWFRPCVLSYEVGSMKPAARIYEVCEDHAGCQGASIFFTDDRAENIAAAARRGWATYQFGSESELLERLRQWSRL